MEIVENLLASSDIDVNLQNNSGESALSFAARDGHLEIVKMLLEHPLIAVNGSVTLDEALKNGGLDVVEMFQHSDFNFQRAIKEALRWRHWEVAQTLLQSHYFDSAMKSRGFTTIHCAAMSRSAEAVRWSLAHGSRVDSCDKQLWTPLHWAAYISHAHSVSALQEAGADNTLRDWQGWTALDVAIFAECSPEVQDLLSVNIMGRSKPVESGELLRGSCNSCGQV